MHTPVVIVAAANKRKKTKNMESKLAIATIEGLVIGRVMKWKDKITTPIQNKNFHNWRVKKPSTFNRLNKRLFRSFMSHHKKEERSMIQNVQYV